MRTKASIKLKGGMTLEFSMSCTPDEAADVFEGCESIESAGFSYDPLPDTGLQSVWLQRNNSDLPFCGSKAGDMLRGKFGYLVCTAD